MIKFSDPQLDMALELFLRIITDFFKNQLVSVILYGSIVFDDLAPGYGDLDFLAVVTGDLSEETDQQLIELRKPLRSGEYGELAKMIEGAFLPRHMLNPANTGMAFWWGTSGEKMWQSNQLGWLVLHTIHERGTVIWGEDVRHEIPAPTREQLLQDVGEFCRTIKKHGKGGRLHSVDWLLTAARELLWLKERRLSSKSEAADWGYRHATGAWREHLPRAKELRKNPALASSAEWQQWLGQLTAPIREAGEELERELHHQRGASIDNDS
jgi:predicted nucleotidyltransferase